MENLKTFCGIHIPLWHFYSKMSQSRPKLMKWEFATNYKMS